MKKILLLEDDENLNRGISLKLTKEGYEVFSASTMGEARAVFEAETVDLVISDISLPDGSGLDFGRWVRRRSDALLIYLTAMDQEIDIVNGYDTGADDYVTKPFSVNILTSKVNAFMRRRGEKEEGLLLSGDLEVSVKEMQVKKAGSLVTLSRTELLRFRRGDFEMKNAPEAEGGEIQWERVCDLLRELGSYFSDLKQQLEAEENATKALITDISHQLKTPLASVLMCHELAASGELSGQEQSEFLAAEERELLKMETLLDELVKLSRLEHHMIQMKPQRDSLRQTISEAVSRSFPKAHAKKIEICVDIDTDAQLSHDRRWTVEALANILENAVKYSPQETQIAIRVSYLPSFALIEIEDQGIGIPEAELHEIFKRFYRGKRAREQERDGAGVGLYLARTIIERQGGALVAKRKLENGSIFKVMLPL